MQKQSDEYLIVFLHTLLQVWYFYFFFIAQPWNCIQNFQINFTVSNSHLAFSSVLMKIALTAPSFWDLAWRSALRCSRLALSACQFGNFVMPLCAVFKWRCKLSLKTVIVLWQMNAQASEIVHLQDQLPFAAWMRFLLCLVCARDAKPYTQHLIYLGTLINRWGICRGPDLAHRPLVSHMY